MHGAALATGSARFAINRMAAPLFTVATVLGSLRVSSKLTFLLFLASPEFSPIRLAAGVSGGWARPHFFPIPG
jgi:hypothetical protein